MYKGKFNILCAYHDRVPDWLGTDPCIELSGHEIVEVHNFEDAVWAILSPKRDIPTFDAILADAWLPSSSEELGFKYAKCLEEFMETYLVSGLGIFLKPSCITRLPLIASNGLEVTVASQDCWTDNGGRNWSKLLNLVVRASEEAEISIDKLP